MRGTIFVGLLVVAAGCSPKPPQPGPVAYRGAQHMRDYLAGARAWKLWYQEDPVQYWQFAPDGSFSVWIEGESETDLRDLFSATIPANAKRLTGVWDVTDDQLKLSQVSTTAGENAPSFDLDLKWVDGKLRIEIGGHHYMRQ